MYGKLGDDPVGKPEQFKGDRLSAKGQVAEKLCKSLRPYIELGRQGKPVGYEASVALDGPGGGERGACLSWQPSVYGIPSEG